MNDIQKPSRIHGRLLAVQVLNRVGRTASAKALQHGIERERVLLALSQPRSTHPRRKNSSSIRVATILDEFSNNSFSPFFHGIALLPDRWRTQFAETRPQIFFCESAWSGADSSLRPWKGRIYASRNFAHENRSDLLDILAHCRKEGIPTVFWNKEDPTHYPDRVHDFVKTAAGFDHVFTTASECVEQYKADYGLKNVYPLPFATNPGLFNPIETAPRSDAVTFAGAWYANHKNRSKHMHDILRGLHTSGYDLEIYNRYHGDNDPLHFWPDEYTPFLHPAVPHSEVAQTYKRSRLALNINTVTESRTMFARRVFELMSSNTLVLSNHSVGIEEFFGRDVIFCDREPDRLATLDDKEIDAIRERCLTNVLSNHTYRHRWEEILTRVGLPFDSAAETITVAWPVHTHDDAKAALAWFQKEADPSLDRLLLLAMDDMAPLDVSMLYEAFNRYGITVTSLYHAEKLAIEPLYAPVETDHFAMMNPLALPSPGWLRRARLHLQYVQGTAITEATETDTRYQLEKTSCRHATTIYKAGTCVTDASLTLHI